MHPEHPMSLKEEEMKGSDRTDREANPHELAKAVRIILEESPETGPEDLAKLLTKMPRTMPKHSGQSEPLIDWGGFP
jgi:hypothetical protein